MAINFPDFPDVGDQYLVAGILYEWDGGSWSTNTSVSFIGNRIDSVFRQANSAYDSQNTTGVYANTAFESQNTTGVYANAAYAHANTRFASVGGTVSGDVVITGNLRVAGLTTYVSSTDLNIGDNIITLNADLEQDANPTESAGIQVERGIENNVAVLWDESSNKWVFTNDGAAYSNIGSSASESFANSAYTQANTATSDAAQADQRAVTSGLYANNAYAHSNSSYIHANASYDFANSLVGGAASDGWARDAANSASSYANGAFTSQNTTGIYANSSFSAANSKVSKSGDTINGSLTIVGGISQSSGDIDIGGSTYQTIIPVSALDIDCSQGNYFTKTISATSTFTFSNVPSSRAYMFALEVTHTSGTINWPASVKWPFDTPPTLTTGTTHIFVFITDNGGTRWRGAALVDYVN